MVHLHCRAVGCSNDSRKITKFGKYLVMLDANGNVVAFFPLPSAARFPKQRKSWIKSLRRQDFDPGAKERWHNVCSKYFVDGRPTERNPIPTLFQYNNFKRPVTERPTKSAVNARSVISVIKLLKDKPGHEEDICTGNKDVHAHVHVPTQPEFTSTMYIPKQPCAIPVRMDHTYITINRNENIQDLSDVNVTELMDKNIMLQKENEMLKEECSKLKGDNMQLQKELMETREELHSKFGTKKDETFRGFLIERLTKNFSWITISNVLIGLFNILCDSASKMKYWKGPSSSDSKKWHERSKKKPGKSRKLSLFHEFVLCLLRFRLNLSLEFLGLLFGISMSSASSIFTSWISLLNQVLSPLLKWPSRNKVMKHMPLAFRLKYPKTRVIIDATEFYVQRPRNPTAQSKTWSNYKSKNTFKAMEHFHSYQIYGQVILQTDV